MQRLAPLLLLFAAACPRPEPLPMPKLPPAPPINVPAGCAANLAGSWVHLDDATWRYQARDDGGTLELDTWRVFSTPLPDAGSAPEADGPGPGAPASAARIRLARTPEGFKGGATADVLHPLGRICTATWPVEVVACSDKGLVVRAASAVSLGDGCQTPIPPRSPVMLEHRLGRADGGLLRPGTTP